MDDEFTDRVANRHAFRLIHTEFIAARNPLEGFLQDARRNVTDEDLRGRLARIREARELVIRTSELVQGRVAADGGGVAGPPGYFGAARALRAELENLAAHDVVLRDPDAGLVDLPGVVEGRPVWLCWRADEERVGHYHELDSGFAGRRPL